MSNVEKLCPPPIRAPIPKTFLVRINLLEQKINEYESSSEILICSTVEHSKLKKVETYKKKKANEDGKCIFCKEKKLSFFEISA